MDKVYMVSVISDSDKIVKIDRSSHEEGLFTVDINGDIKELNHRFKYSTIENETGFVYTQERGSTFGFFCKD